MSHKTVCQLPSETAKLIASTQIITSVSTAVKELLENSLDAGANNIQIKLDNYGLDTIEVKDDGTGVSYDNVQRMFLPGYTSKIRQFEDLDKLRSYGFRGEALGALCKVANVSITTKTSNDTLAMTYVINSDGIPLSSKPSHLNKGTIVSVSNLFSKLPVRKQYLSSKKRTGEELKKVEQVVQSLSVVHPELRLTLIHNKSSIWQKNSVRGLRHSFMQIIGLRAAAKLEHVNETTHEVIVDLILPKRDLEDCQYIFSNNNNSVYIHINKRPVASKEISKIVMEHIFHHFNNQKDTNKFATCLVSICLSPQDIDVNLEPNKTKIFLKNQKDIISLLDDILSTYYRHKITRPADANPEPEEIEEEEKEETEDPERKKPRLEQEFIHKSRNEEFIEKNSNWRLDYINKEACLVIVDENQKSQISESSKLCSQINTNNCILSEKEIDKANEVIYKNKANLVTSVSSYNSDVRQEQREDIQSNVIEKPELPVWPSRTQHKNDVIEEIVKEIEMDAEKWSKGQLKIGGGNLQGGAVLLQPEPQSESLSQTEVEKEDIAQFDLSVQSISSQMGKKELSSFTKFARIMRPKIIEQYPNIVFSKVAGLLVDRWKDLSPDERKYYEKMSKIVAEERKTHQENKANQKQVPEKKTETKHDIKTLFNRIKEKSQKKRPARRQITINISLDKVIKSRVAARQETDEKIQLIGQLRPSGNWLYRKNQEIGHVRHIGLQELVISQKMLSNHSVPRTEAEKPIFVTEETLGSRFWNVLVSLDSEYDQLSCKFVVTNEVISKNGFQIELEKHEGVVSSAFITQVASTIPHYGVTELRDVLRLYEETGEFAGLFNWRPVPVSNYITNEAIRMSHQSLRIPDRADLQDLLETWQVCLQHMPPQCLHCKDIFIPIYELNQASKDNDISSQKEN